MWYGESTYLGSIPSQVERLPFFESNFSVVSTGKKHFARIMQELQFSFLFTPSHTAAGLGENRQLVTDEPVEFEK
jgi:hypothetical protein